MSELGESGALNRSLDRALERWGAPARRERADRGKARLHPEVEAKLANLLRTRDRPSFSALHRELAVFCKQRGHRVPARTSIYNAIDRVEPPALAWGELPDEVRQALYNLHDGCWADATQRCGAPERARRIPSDQVVFYAFNYGSPRAVSFASGLSWLSLERASKRRGWRPKSFSLLEAVLRYRNIR